ncbi:MULTISPECIES: N-formylglutamate deformylase [unclassified Sphingomonas]|uniref:N-formylglutamate deformylase n=1 Tax=unclassified Sphingomonas TaxID=196159 RepID=UPI0006F7E720|nr:MULTISPECIES: N-formylglutamate deformylase [unclassified Sphingomonas]KQX19669.1 N-formylglutamate deformylase [Sphingomonas sp. Root1294]KQY65870.1 N-formylglutamate deformylase [Sphingomonas sp. Root50]KRB95555.1 N-formylglutamate deformylase [Sphingomonas sp. Root720]
MIPWLDISRGEAPLVVAFPHSGTEIPEALEGSFTSPWLARKDADWWIDRVYAFAASLGATTIRSRISRSVIDLNRDPSGASLYPGQATTELCPTTTFAGEPLYRDAPPDAGEVGWRRSTWFDPYHDALAAELDRLRTRHGRVVLYDAHSILSHVPRLFDGELPLFNIGTNNGTTCDRALSDAVVGIAAASGHSHVLDGRFRGGWTTRHYGRPADGIHAIQMELAMRAYMAEPSEIGPETWPAPFDPASPVIADLRAILSACLAFARR